MSDVNIAQPAAEESDLLTNIFFAHGGAGGQAVLRGQPADPVTERLVF